jgi:hypothetical protein
MRTFAGITIFLAALCWTRILSAEDYEYAYSLYGEPLQRIEQESRRRQIWVYRTQQLIFQDGQLLRSARQTTLPAITSATKPQSKKTTVAAVSSGLLQEVFKELSSKNGKSTASGSGAATTKSPLATKLQQMRGQVAPPNLPMSDVTDDDFEEG